MCGDSSSMIVTSVMVLFRVGSDVALKSDNSAAPQGTGTNQVPYYGMLPGGYYPTGAMTGYAPATSAFVGSDGSAFGSTYNGQRADGFGMSRPPPSYFPASSSPTMPLCRHWPKCLYGNTCRYYHPTIMDPSLAPLPTSEAKSFGRSNMQQHTQPYANGLQAHWADEMPPHGQGRSHDFGMYTLEIVLVRSTLRAWSHHRLPRHTFIHVKVGVNF
jgi:hypothetical protein